MSDAHIQHIQHSGVNKKAPAEYILEYKAIGNENVHNSNDNNLRYTWR